MITAPAPFRHVEKNVSILPEGPPHAATPPNPCDVLPFRPPTTLCWTPQPSGIMSCLCPITKLMACCSWHLIQMIFFLSLHSTQLNSSSSSLAAPYLPRFWRERKKKNPDTRRMSLGGFFIFPTARHVVWQFRHLGRPPRFSVADVSNSWIFRRDSSFLRPTSASPNHESVWEI